jgi:hypothetical protein
VRAAPAGCCIASSPDTVGRSTAITVISAVPWYWALWLRFTFRRIRRRQRLCKKPSNIDQDLWKLSFIHFAHWGVFERVPPSGPRLKARWLPRPYLLFQSNFNGSAWVYIEAFSLVVGRGMRALWGRAYRAPPPVPVAPFIEYIRGEQIPTSYYYCAYPQASTKMVRTALATKERVDALVKKTVGLDDDAFANHYWCAVKELERPPPGEVKLGERDGLCVLTPLSSGHEEALAADLKALETGEASPFAGIEGTHFARFAIVPHLKTRKGRKVGSTSYLLFAAEFDALPERYVAELCTRLSPKARDLWSRHCADSPQAGDPGALQSYLLEHRVKPGYSVLGYPRAELPKVLRSLELRTRLEQFFPRASDMSSDDLKSAFEKDVLPSPP